MLCQCWRKVLVFSLLGFFLINIYVLIYTFAGELIINSIVCSNRIRFFYLIQPVSVTVKLNIEHVSFTTPAELDPVRIHF